MSKFERRVLQAVTLLFCFAGSAGLTQAQSLRLGAGISSPFEQIAAVRFPLPQGGSFLYPVSQSQNTGYHAAARYMMSTSDGIGFTIAGGVHQFETPIFSVFDPSQPMPTSVKVSQTLVPLGVGFEYRILTILFLHAYAAAEANYHALVSSTEYAQPSGITLKQTLSHRVGGTVAVGADMTIFGIGADVSLRYHWINVLLRESQELSKTFWSVNVSLLLGSK